MDLSVKVRLLICVTLCAAFYSSAFAGNQSPGTYLLRGVITGVDGELLSGATIRAYAVAGDDDHYADGISSDAAGSYTIRLKTGRYRIAVSFLGYADTEQVVEVAGDTSLDFTLAPTDTEVEGVVVIADRGKIHQSTMGMERLSPAFIRSMPSFLGEADVLKSLQLLPGVQATSEGGSGFSVRGGSHDQNLILLDDATLYNASHLMGFFSVFNNDVVDDVTLYKGDIPASFGGRLSSLLDVKTRDGARERLGGSGGVGLISSRVSLEGPLGHDRAGFLVSARRTYADMFLKLSRDKDLRKSKLYFYDANLRLSWEPGLRDRIYVSGYLGRDKLGTTFAGMDFGNKALSVKWSHIFTPQLYGTLSVTASQYDYEVTAKIGKEIDQYWRSSMTDLGARGEIVWTPGSHTLRAGWNMVYHWFRPGNMASNMDDPLLGEIKLPRQDAVENALYVSAESPLWSGVRLRYGLRASFFANVASVKSRGAGNADEKYGSGLYGQRSNLEPRVGLIVETGENSSFKLSYARTAQYIHIASNSAAGSPLDVWFQSSPSVKPQLSDQYSAGYFTSFGQGWELSSEIYYRRLKNTIDFRDHAELILNENLEEEILVGRGYAYGVELMLKRRKGNLDGWISYAYGRAKRKTDGINDDRWYRSQFDRPHNVNIVAMYNLSEKWNFSAGWVYSTGTPISFPTGKFLIESEYVPIYDGRNRHRYPDYHRLDLAATLKLKQKRVRLRSELSFSLYNAYGRKNPWMISFKEEASDPGAFYAEQVYLFSVVPSVTWNFYF